MLSFMGGWVILAHSPKPIQPSQTTVVNIAPLPMPTLPPIQAFGDASGNGNNLNFVAPNPQPFSGFPILRSGGS
jgi:hypothetical protein